MKDPTLSEIFEHLSKHYDMPKMALAAITKTPLHPHELRDEFAKQAMQSLLLMPDEDNGHLDYSYEPEAIAALAYLLADAMLKERAK